MGGDIPNEDEYSAALERLLEGCPACTQCSSQIGGAVSMGGALHMKRGKLGVGWGEVKVIGVADRQGRHSCWCTLTS